MIKLGQLKRQCAIITADCDIRTAVWTLTVSKLVRTYVLSFNYRIVLAVLVMLMLLILILLSQVSIASYSQDSGKYPNKPITFIASSAPGGTTDFTARVLAQPLGTALGQTIVVDNPAGAGGSIGTAKVARSAPDGYTLLMIHISHATNVLMIKNLPYSPIDDFEPIGLATVGPMVVTGRQHEQEVRIFPIS